jgi:hypothetical protein
MGRHIPNYVVFTRTAERNSYLATNYLLFACLITCQKQPLRMFQLIFPCAGKKGFKMSDMSIATELVWKLWIKPTTLQRRLRLHCHLYVNLCTSYYLQCLNMRNRGMEFENTLRCYNWRLYYWTPLQKLWKTIKILSYWIITRICINAGLWNVMEETWKTKEERTWGRCSEWFQGNIPMFNNDRSVLKCELDGYAELFNSTKW